MGYDRVMFGTDYPYDMGAYHPSDLMQASALMGGQLRAVMGGNAEAALSLRLE